MIIMIMQEYYSSQLLSLQLIKKKKTNETIDDYKKFCKIFLRFFSIYCSFYFTEIIWKIFLTNKLNLIFLYKYLF